MDKSVKFRIELESNGEKVLHNISVSAEDLRETIEGVVSETQKMRSDFSSLTERSVLVSSINNVIGQLGEMTSGLAAEFDSFDKSMRAVNTMAGKGEADFAGLKDQVNELAEVIPLAKEELAGGLYQVISNGVPEDNWIEFLNRSSRAAVGGIADLGQTVTVTSTIIKNYGLDWAAAGEIQDKIQMTAKNGVTSFEQLAAALPRVTGNAATLGVSVDELMASFSTLTGVSGNTAEVSTQLAAIFTALVKPSSEAAEMAEQMGIQFDAASIKAAGGMRNFLVELDGVIQQYAASHDMLAQEIYGKLFGSAESLRALIPLTGELSDKFGENVDAMAGSAGTIDTVFEQMSSTGEASRQMLKNHISTMMEWAGSAASAIQPYQGLIIVVSQSIMSFATLGKGIMAAGTSLRAFIAAQKLSTLASMRDALYVKMQTMARNMLAAAGYSAAAGTTALTVATTALYAAMSLGLTVVITGLVSALGSLFSTSEDAAEGVAELDEAQDAFTRKSGEVKAALDAETKKLKSLMDAKEDTTAAVKHLNEEYGTVFGNHQTAAEWYDILIKKSKDYAMQLGYEAQAKLIASQIAQKQMQLEDDYDKRRELWKSGKAQTTVTRAIGGGNAGNVQTVSYKADSKEYADLKSQDAKLISEIKVLQKNLDRATGKAAEYSSKTAATVAPTNQQTKAVRWQAMSYTELGDAIEKQKKKVAGYKDGDKRLAAESKQLKAMEARYKKMGESRGLTSSTKSGSGSHKRVIVADPKTDEELSTNIDLSKKKLTGEDNAEQKKLREQIALWEKKRAEIDLANKAAERPGEIITLQDTEKELEYLRALRKTVSGETLAQTDELIAKTELYAASLSRPAQLNTLQDIDAEINYQRKLKSAASKEAVGAINEEINKLQTLQKNFENADVIAMPDDALESYGQLNKKLQYYTDLLENATGGARPEIRQHIKDLDDIKKAWDEAAEAADRPADISKLTTQRDLSEAVRWYDTQIQRADADEIEALQRTRNELQAKHDALTAIAEIPVMQQETADLSKLEGKELRMELEVYGIDGIKSKIKSLQKMLDDIKNPLGDSQRAEVKKLVGEWTRYEKTLRKSQADFRGAWGSLKSIGGGVQSLTDALAGNKDAWTTVTGVVDSFIEIYDGVNSVIGIIEALTAATTASSAATTASEVAATSATAAKTAAAPEEVAAATATTVATKVEAMAFRELAASEFMAAHAYIPFAGASIAAGFIGMMQGLVSSVSVTPFADGGIVYGPTIGLMGEYSGARNNPEVIAPLNKLKSLIGDTGGGGIGRVVGRLKGRDIELVLANETRLSHKRSNIRS